MSIDITAAAATIVALSVAVERMVEAFWIIVEGIMRLIGVVYLSKTPQNKLTANQETSRRHYQLAKTLVSIPVAIGIGIGLAFGGTTLNSAPFNTLSGGAVAAIGAPAGFLAPYSHQLLDLGFAASNNLKG